MFVRWENLTVGLEEGRRLPGYRDPAVIRTFDAPEALDTRFYEVNAKSALNKVPEASRMPFRWTINPYRGCTHACTYCGGGDTEVLLEDGRTRQLAELKVGDRIYGTRQGPTYRHYDVTTVLAHWATRKKAFRITLEDGTELVASGDHRFLTNRGWKHVEGSEWGPLQRPHLTLNNKLVGMGKPAPPPYHSEGYRRGYLCGLIRGDGTLGSYTYERSNGRVSRHHGFRLALIDLDALDRASRLLLGFGVPTTEFLFQPAGAVGQSKEAMAIRATSGGRVDRIRELITWPRAERWAGDEWAKGYLAGIFDAEGSSNGVIRIANTDPEIIGWTTHCLRKFGFGHVVEDPGRENGMRVVRLLGGLPERTRFFQSTDPAIERKRSIQGLALKSDARLDVVEIEPLGVERELYDIQTGTGDFIANGVVSHNCFARPTHEYLDMDAGRDFEKEIVVKVNAPEVLRAELGRPSWKREHVALGTNTDPYQWVEGRYKLMRGIWEAMRDFRNECSILTKSPLLLRDIDLMKEIQEVAGFSACLSIPTLDEKTWRATEPHTPHPRKRIEAVAELNRAGIPTGVLVAPLMPGINDSPRQVEPLVQACAEAGAVSIGGIALHLRGSVKGVFFDWLEQQRPQLLQRYERLYGRRAYAPAEERRRIQTVLQDARKKSPLKPRPRSGPLLRGGRRPKEPAVAEPPALQESLF